MWHSLMVILIPLLALLFPPVCAQAPKSEMIVLRDSTVLETHIVEMSPNKLIYQELSDPDRVKKSIPLTLVYRLHFRNGLTATFSDSLIMARLRLVTTPGPVNKQPWKKVAAFGPLDHVGIYELNQALLAYQSKRRKIKIFGITFCSLTLAAGTTGMILSEKYRSENSFHLSGLNPYTASHMLMFIGFTGFFVVGTISLNEHVHSKYQSLSVEQELNRRKNMLGRLQLGPSYIPEGQIHGLTLSTTF
ncbi:hypothetical protein CLV98_107151 [Dyadobacter jejuensis]|uniref:Uncharacterized protein n=1 Tax=Dyadobacter jejuensis TaxID=1082580 RepID=A0A316AIC0_9BACT|nr:hypothetical protein [Dyadobacter jejuensis]PWJ57443.1 hypothetical protein CLV98_107151 [Dyadobacter jejuensis]